MGAKNRPMANKARGNESGVRGVDMTPDALFMLTCWMLTGMALGFLSTFYGACRSQVRMWPGLRDALDWLWFVVAAILFLLVLFWTDWGVFKVWSIAWVALGYLVWSWLAAPLVFGVLVVFAHAEARTVHWLLRPWMTMGRRGRRMWQGISRNRKKPPKNP